MERQILFKTVHGSRLYGLAHADSDYDYYTVVTKKPVDTRWGKQTRSKYAKQKIVGDVDSMVLDLGTWLEQCRAGVPQALEAMFSDMVEVDLIKDLRANYRASTGVYERYWRTIKSFALSEDDGIKKRRHALRLALNLRELGATGRFNPTLSKEDAEFVTLYATKSHEDVYGLAKCLAWEI